MMIISCGIQQRQGDAGEEGEDDISGGQVRARPFREANSPSPAIDRILSSFSPPPPLPRSSSTHVVLRIIRARVLAGRKGTVDRAAAVLRPLYLLFLQP